MISHYSTTGATGVDVVVAFDPRRENPVLMADSKHPHFNSIREGLARGDESVLDLFDVGEGISRKFEQVTDRVSYNGREILFDGDPVHNVLTEQLQRAIEAGEDSYAPLAKFWEKLESNPNEHSREQAYNFLAAHSFQITEDGDVVGFKGCSTGQDGRFFSTTASTVSGKPSAFVDGQPVPERSLVPNDIGTIVSMPRSEVVHDPNQYCSRGLHVSTRSYAESYGRRGAVLEVHVNPRDIVSVPNDAGGEKVRVCRYKVARVSVDDMTTGPVLHDSAPKAWAGDVGYATQ